MDNEEALNNNWRAVLDLRLAEAEYGTTRDEMIGQINDIQKVEEQLARVRRKEEMKMEQDRIRTLPTRLSLEIMLARIGIHEWVSQIRIYQSMMATELEPMDEKMFFLISETLRSAEDEYPGSQLDGIVVLRQVNRDELERRVLEEMGMELMLIDALHMAEIQLGGQTYTVMHVMTSEMKRTHEAIKELIRALRRISESKRRGK